MDDVNKEYFVDGKKDFEDSSAQVEPKVKVKLNRGLRRDVLKKLEVNPNLTPNEVFEALKNNSYGGSSPVSLNTVQSTMCQLKRKDVQNVG